ncbi:protein FAR1-RELATED SEQUENCE 5-like [Spinacia oleracea]|uniref:Protein FAR1-RELATED SEQUENCE 5-like n=1 Tax=Spinacia oleracea TaxID=3562 RepID=A0ABM3QX77_SPIOL|nr:protein FAR1-RELATED SEQUENCE 5-like [Spinacia oleracea]
MGVTRLFANGLDVSPALQTLDLSGILFIRLRPRLTHPPGTALSALCGTHLLLKDLVHLLLEPNKYFSQLPHRNSKVQVLIQHDVLDTGTEIISLPDGAKCCGNFVGADVSLFSWRYQLLSLRASTMEDDLIDLNIDLNRAIEEKLYNYDENLENHREVYDVEDEDEGTSQQVMVANQCSIRHSIETNHNIFENPNNEQEENIDKELDGSLIGEARKTTDEIYDLYCKHAAIIGFSVRKGKNRYKEGTTIVNGKYFYCSAAGIRDPPKNKELKNEDDQSDHVVVHNHPLTREISNYLHRSERQMTEPKKEVIEAMSECGLRPMEFYRYMSTETGGDDCVGHTMIDHLNYCYKLKMKQIDGKDSQTLVNKLYDIQSIDPEFFFRVRLNAEGKVECLFWRDSMMREDYKIYGDVLVFYTTFRTNKYNLICAPFVGINNHWKNTMFACAFIGDETTESFVWVFETFLKAMGGKHPISIFTDQDAAIAAGIEQVFPSSRHRLCLWHLSKNANSRFGLLKSDKNFKNAFYKCLSGCITPNDFEET